MNESANTFRGSWKLRIRALKNVPPLLSIVWNSGPGVVSAATLGRIVGALVPLSMLTVSKRILDSVQAHYTGAPLPASFWYLVGAEAVLAVFGSLVGRTTSYFDGLLADRFTRYVSVRVMEHASRLDLASYEDPAFYDKLERARVQGSDRIAMVQSIGTVVQQSIVAVSLAAGIVWFSPWLLVLLVVAVVPAFLGESHFAFEGYSLNITQTPVRRQLDYLRTLGASKESAKELKLFDLSGYLTGEYLQLSNELYDQNVRLAQRRLWVGAFLSLLSTGAYYGAYAYVIYRTVTGTLSWGSLQFLAGALAGASTNIQNIFAVFSNIADQSLFLTDLVEFLRVKPKIGSKPHALPAPRPIRRGLCIRRGVVQLSGLRAPRAGWFGPADRTRGADRADRRKRAGKDDDREAAHAALRSHSGRILLDGVDLRDYSVEDLHRQIGVIFQDFVRYEMTARQNIAAGRVSAAEERAIRHAARKSGADEVVDRLPARVRAAAGPAFRGRGGPIGRRVAEDGAGPRLFAGRANSDSGRADRGPGRALRIRGVPALCRAHRRQNGVADIASLLHGSHGGPDCRIGKRANR